MQAHQRPRAAMDPNVVMEAYIQALLETFTGNELEIIDLIGKFPGAPIISYFLATVACPIPAFFNPSIADFIKARQLPICRDMKEINWPTLMWPPMHLLGDIWEALKIAAKAELAKLYRTIMYMIMYKICEIIGEAICNALETVGALVAAVATGDNVRDAIRESICGDDVNEEELTNTVTELLESFGNGGAAFSDPELVLQFTGDISSTVTQKELAEAFLGDAGPEFTGVIDTLVEYEFPQLRTSLPGPSAIATMFQNMGNVMPVDFRQQLRDFVNELPPDEKIPATPTLCATPEQVEEFCEMRAQLLDGRATPAQIQAICENYTDQLTDDLGDLAGIMQGGLPAFLEDNMPPLVSEPGCDNGLFPYEPEEVAAATSAGLGGQLEMLKVAYAEDMLGNGPGKKNWGLMNMILSDTMANPLTAHHRKVSNQKRFVDFYTDWEPSGEDSDGNAGNLTWASTGIHLLVLCLPILRILIVREAPIRFM